MSRLVNCGKVDRHTLLSMRADFQRIANQARGVFDEYTEAVGEVDRRIAALDTPALEPGAGAEKSARADRRRRERRAPSREEAYAILGIAQGSTVEDIKAAYHRLMPKLHPDHGGSTYLAARVNAARDLLLKFLKLAA